MGGQGKKRYIEQRRTNDDERRRRTTWTIIIPRQDSQNPRANNTINQQINMFSALNTHITTKKPYIISYTPYIA